MHLTFDCGVPATWKLAGVLSHNARLCCSGYLKEFHVKTFEEQPNNSGFDRDTWHKWSVYQHCTDAISTLKST